MNDKARKNLVKGTIEAINSLRISIQNAGGDGESLTNIKEMESMTVLDFIANVAAPNGIRFHYEDRHYEESKKESKSTSSDPRWLTGFINGHFSICDSCGKLSVYEEVCQRCGWGRAKVPDIPIPAKTIRCPDCGSNEYGQITSFARLCHQCKRKWFTDINYKIVCDNCGQNQVGFDGFCRDCNWEQIKTKEDLNKIQVHTQP